MLYSEQGHYGEAEPLYRRALEIREKALGPDHPDVANSLNNVASLYHVQGLPLQASPFYDRTLAVLGRQFDYYFTYMTEKERLQFLASVSYNFPTYFSFCLSYREQLPELVGKMYDAMLWEKGFIAQSVVALRAKIEASGDAEALRLLDRLTERKSELAKLAWAPAESDPQRQVTRRANVDRLEKEANEIERELVTRSTALGEEKRLARASWEQVRDALKPDEAAVEIGNFPFSTGKKWTGTSYYVALVLRHDSREPEFVVLGEQKELEKVALPDYRRLVAPPDQPRPVGLGHEVLYSLLEAPGRKTEEGEEGVYFTGWAVEPRGFWSSAG